MVTPAKVSPLRAVAGKPVYQPRGAGKTCAHNAVRVMQDLTLTLPKAGFISGIGSPGCGNAPA